MEEFTDEEIMRLQMEVERARVEYEREKAVKQIQKIELQMEVERIRQELIQEQEKILRNGHEEHEIVERVERILRGRVLSRDSYTRIKHMLDITLRDDRKLYVNKEEKDWYKKWLLEGSPMKEKDFIEKDEMEI